MSIFWEWLIVVALLAGTAYLAYRYYRAQRAKYSGGKHNPAVDELRGKTGCH